MHSPFWKGLSRSMDVYRELFEHANNGESCFETDKERFTHGNTGYQVRSDRHKEVTEACGQ